MLEALSLLPADPILNLIVLYRDDPNPRKVDLGVGVYKDEQGLTPVMRAVKQAEACLLEEQDSKAYLGAAGNPAFNAAMTRLLLGDQTTADDRWAILQTPGGCGALRVAAELIKTAKPDATIWVSDPTWGNHRPLLGNSGLALKAYPYYDPASHGLNFDAMMNALLGASPGDIVLLHGSCHNPTGVDLGPDQWLSLAKFMEERQLIPFVDMAYQGFGAGVEEDAQGLRLLCQRLPEVLVAASCSKNFGLYRERVGAVGLLADSAASARASYSHLLAIVRGIYSMPPDHGAALVARVLSDPDLHRDWLVELTSIRERIQNLRSQFSAEMSARLGHGHFDFVHQQVGMFSFLGLTEGQVAQLADQYSIYLLGSSRASIAGLNSGNLAYVCDALHELLSARAL